MVELITKKECPLCNEARDVLLSVRNKFPFELKETYLEPGTSTEERYRVDIPVININGLFFARHSISGEALYAYLRQISSGGKST
ncbi:MAG: glutaredoxin family protein [Ignavibacteria bacterium]|nr:glutaredoxin family protein [Ignavibacteria bacterium]